MCGRYLLISQQEAVAERYRAVWPDYLEYEPRYNIAPGEGGVVISQEFPQVFQMFQFGLTPFWAKKPMYLFNARSEGDYNPDNSLDYSGPMGIGDKPSFRHPIRRQRCLVPANAFIEGPSREKLNLPHLVYVKSLPIFSLAGIWDQWTEPKTGSVLHSFSIITTRSNTLLQKIPHHRSPVILRPEQEALWLSDLRLEEVYELLQPYPAEDMNGFAVDKKIKNPQAEGPELIQATKAPFSPDPEGLARFNTQLPPSPTQFTLGF